SIDDYKASKDIEINQNLDTYKTNTTEGINTYKNTKDSEINQYKIDKDSQIDNYVAGKNKELDRYVAAKNKEIDDYKVAKDTLINDKLKEVDTTEKSRQEAEVLRQQQHQDRESFLNSYENKVNGIEEKNTAQDSRLSKVESKNKSQDVFLQGLMNENSDGRLTVESAGNNLKLEGSKQGLVTVENVVGNSLVNLYENKTKVFNTGVIYSKNESININLLKTNTKYTFIILDESGRVARTKICSGDDTILLMPNTSTKVTVFTTPTSFDSYITSIRAYCYPSSTVPFVSGDENKIKYILLEGDYTNKPIPQEVFTGIQSSFEDKKVTQEMVDSGTELASNLGKYKVSAKVVGKNKFNQSDPMFFEKVNDSQYNIVNGRLRLTYTGKSPSTVATYTCIRFLCKLEGIGTCIRFNAKCDAKNGRDGLIGIRFYRENSKDATIGDACTVRVGNTLLVSIPSGAKYFSPFFYSAAGEEGVVNGDYIDYYDCMVEETNEVQQVNTPYVPYVEYEHNLYLNNPLLKGDELICRADGVYHRHIGYRKTYNGGVDESWTHNKTDNNTLLFQINLNPNAKDSPPITTFGKSIASGASVVDEEIVQIYTLGT
ncbi:hypothetical protein, partial [Clostridium perfringens]|uniref:hypothetical protein n=1 Tax=Clostridium perfringens TaxID=1502 RepID=UPI0023315AC2